MRVLAKNYTRCGFVHQTWCVTLFSYVAVSMRPCSYGPLKLSCAMQKRWIRMARL